MQFLPQEVIRKKRDNLSLSDDEIKNFITGVVGGAVSKEQIAAFCMAAYFNSFTLDECKALTLSMCHSGDVFSWKNLDGPILDKHSTGGIGDNVSLILAPILAACGAYVPMISGRGLGHTGGTLDKLEAISGYSISPSQALLDETLKEVGCAIIGQTQNLAPADKIIYGVRDVTATVENIGLVTASILSKKLAEGLDALILDVKCGSGSFNPTQEDAQNLAQNLVKIASSCGLKTSAIISDMNEPLASCAGNGIESKNAIDFLMGNHRNEKLYQVVITLASQLLISSQLATSKQDAQNKIDAALDEGKAAEKFEQMVAKLGGTSSLLKCYNQTIEKAPIIKDILPPKTAEGKMVSAIDARKIGMAVIALGGGRTIANAPIDHAVGFDNILPLGAKVEEGCVLARIHARDEAELEHAAKMLQQAYGFDVDYSPSPAILEIIGDPS